MDLLDTVCDNFGTVIKSEDIQKYAGNGIWNLIRFIYSGNVFVGASVAKDVKELMFHVPTAIFWNKMQRFLLGTFTDKNVQIKMAEKFNDDNTKYKEYVWQLIDIVDKLESETKIDYFSNLTRAYLLDNIDNDTYYKLYQILRNCTVQELNFIKEKPENFTMTYDMTIFSLKNLGLVDNNIENDTVIYYFSHLAKILKKVVLNYTEISSPIIYGNITPPEDDTPMPITESQLQNLLNMI